MAAPPQGMIRGVIIKLPHTRDVTRKSSIAEQIVQLRNKLLPRNPVGSSLTPTCTDRCFVFQVSNKILRNKLLIMPQSYCSSTICDNRLTVSLSYLVPGKVQNLGSIRISNNSVRVQWREPETTNGAIVNYTVQVQKYQLVSGSRELELVTIGPEFNRTISATLLTLSSDGRFMINISEGLGETERSTCSFFICSYRQWETLIDFIQLNVNFASKLSYEFPIS